MTDPGELRSIELWDDEIERISNLLHDGMDSKFYQPEDIIAVGKLRSHGDPEVMADLERTRQNLEQSR